MRRVWGSALVLIIVVYLCPTPIIAKESPAAPTDTLTHTEEQALVDSALWHLRVTQDGATPAAQDGVTSNAASAFATPAVNEPSFSKLVSLAFDGNLISVGEQNAFTLNFTPFALLSLATGDSIRSSQSWYQRNRWSRRIGFASTFGGKGEKFDQNGDGTVDEPAVAAELFDTVTFELRYTLKGTRDRRDAGSEARFFRATQNAVKPLAADDSTFLNSTDYLRMPRVVMRGGTEGHLRQDFEQYLTLPLTRAVIESIAVHSKSFQKSLDAAVRKVDRALLVTLVAGGTERRVRFGPNLWSTGLRVAAGVPTNADATINLETSIRRGIRSNADTSLWKASAGLGWKILRGALGIDDGLPLDLACSHEWRSHTPIGMHASIERASLTLTLPFAGAGKVPLTLSWANHSDLLSGSRAVFLGHIGFSYEFQPTKKK